MKNKLFVSILILASIILIGAIGSERDFWKRVGNVISPIHSGDTVSIPGSLSIGGANPESATLGAELNTGISDGVGWTAAAGWTNNNDGSFTHASSGGTGTLSFPVASTGTNLYQIAFTSSSNLASNDVTVIIGNSEPYDLYNGEGPTYACGIKSVSDGDLVFTPITTFAKTISNISIKEITGAFSATQTFKDIAGDAAIEIRKTDADLNNVFLGLGSGQYNTTGYDNLGLGKGALSNNTTGYWNVGLGTLALEDNTTGSRNVGIGYNAVKDNISGQRNIGIGSWSLPRNTIGNYNIGIGADSLFQHLSGDFNIGIGYSALGASTTGTKNTAIGRGSLGALTDGHSNTAIGHYAGATGTTTGDYGLFLGAYAGMRETAGYTFYVDTILRSTEADGRTLALMYGTFATAVANQNLTLNPVSIQMPNLPVYADNAAALAGGITAGRLYRTASGVLMVAYTP